VTRRVLVVDDDRSICETLLGHFTRSGIEATVVESAEAALSQLSTVDPDLLFTDVRMPGMDGLTLLALVRERAPDVDIVVMTAFEDMKTAIAAMRAGAIEYLVKPLDLDVIDLVLDRSFRERAVRRRMRHLSAEAAKPYSISELVGRDPGMIDIYKRIGTVARSRTSVLIRGETGTGKEVIARAIHFNSADAEEPFVAVNCTAVPEGLLESELFGHQRGAFTGAVSDRRGRFELAGCGTIFLDEIGDTSLAFQAKLLRVLQEREFYAVGSERPRRTEARVIAATHRPLESLVREGRFREDLYFRLRVVDIEIPPLRARRGDISDLARHLLAKASHELHRVAELSSGAMRALEEYGWPGNVRELENTLVRALALTPGFVIAETDLGLEPSRAAGTGSIATGDADRVRGDRSLRAVEREHIERVLRECDNNKRRACKILGVSRPRLDRLLQRHEIGAVDGL
jgi:two-component system response regulator AtoC